ncbi:hypothetical protein Pmani_003359 [Petrolisthes manimaculis]|uniref:Secreted protein n=1 Tax=Petrolisthes manimaculis TaxID=1843537 RepID=A0AAE1UMK5_9EUCA|nr:hypothetical protein Pmani_003359 [Petrolisthes manimaculis]
MGPLILILCHPLPATVVSYYLATFHHCLLRKRTLGVGPNAGKGEFNNTVQPLATQTQQLHQVRPQYLTS